MTLLLTIAAGFCVFIYLVHELIISKDQQVAQLQAQLEQAKTDKSEQAAKYQAQLEKIQAELEDLKERKRQTGPTQAGLLDALAALSRVQINRKIEETILDSCANTLKQVCKGPYVYPVDKPSGEREDFE